MSFGRLANTTDANKMSWRKLDCQGIAVLSSNLNAYVRTSVSAGNSRSQTPSRIIDGTARKRTHSILRNLTGDLDITYTSHSAGYDNLDSAYSPTLIDSIFLIMPMSTYQSRNPSMKGLMLSRVL
ncbi:hypothetical protein KCU85_g388, partial [Aureobasidium melanogenum]